MTKAEEDNKRKMRVDLTEAYNMTYNTLIVINRYQSKNAILSEAYRALSRVHKTLSVSLDILNQEIRASAYNDK